MEESGDKNYRKKEKRVDEGERVRKREERKEERKHPIPIMEQSNGTRNNDADLTCQNFILCPCHHAFLSLLAFIHFMRILGLSQLLRLLLPLQAKIMKPNKIKPLLLALSTFHAHFCPFHSTHPFHSHPSLLSNPQTLLLFHSPPFPFLHSYIYTPTSDSKIIQ